MFSKYLKSLSILKKFLFINFVIFTIIVLFTFIYLNSFQPNLIKKKSANHLKVFDNTVETILRLEVKFIENDIRKFLFSTRFIFQNLDRVIFYDNNLNILGDTDTLDLDPRSFSTRLNEIEFESLNEINTEKIFKRFYSNRPEKFGEHSGLGLNIVKSIVEMHGGKVRAINRSDAKTGAEIELQLPKRGQDNQFLD